MFSRIRLGFKAISFLLFFSPVGIIAQTRLQPLPPLDSLNFAGLSEQVQQLFEAITVVDLNLKDQLPGLEQTQGLAQEQLAQAKADTTTAKSRLDSLSKSAKKAKEAFKKGTSRSGEAVKLLEFTQSMMGMDSINMRKNLPKTWRQIHQLQKDVFPMEEQPASDTLANAEPPKTKKGKKAKPDEPSDVAATPSNNPPVARPDTAPAKRFASYNPAKDVMLNPPTPPCVVASSSRDEFSGEISKELARAELFRYTNPALKAYLQGKTHVICEAALASTGAKATLLLTFNINDPNARKAFGRMEKNSLATLKFLDGSTFELQNLIADDGVFSAENDGSIFRAQYPLNPEAFKKIRKNGLDRIRILWSKGYEDYEVQQVDLLMRQAECLFK